MLKTRNFTNETNRYSCCSNFIGMENQATLQVNLPAGMKELSKECFTSCASGSFGRKTNLPLLTATSLSILKRLKVANKIKMKSAEQIDVVEVSTAGLKARDRSNSIGTNFYKSDDMLLIRACWEIILSFMGDESEGIQQNQSTSLYESTISLRPQTLSQRKNGKNQSGNSEVVMRKKSHQKRPNSMFVSSNLNEDYNRENQNIQKCAISKETLARMTVLEKVHFLINVGLETSDFRDEIYCQILKQLVGNPSIRSVALGWILLSLLLGCFPPSYMILSYVEKFLQHQRTSYSIYCLNKLKRTLECGERKNPPCSLELHAAKSRQEIRLPIICMDHSVRTIWCDSSTTASEVCDKMAEKNRLGDAFGFALYLALDNKLVSLGNRSFHVMDAIAQAERFTKINDVHEVWRIYYRRELFSPCDACCLNNNQMNIWLTYSQICGGVHSGEYSCSKAQDLSLLMAHQYCVKYGIDKIEMKKVVTVCDQVLPLSAYVDGNKKKWSQMIFKTLRAISNESRSNDRMNAYDVMKQVVCYGSKAFIEKFTKIFHLSKFETVSEDGIKLKNCILKINHSTIVVAEDTANTSLPSTENILSLKVNNLLSAKLVQIREKNRIRISVDDGKIYDCFSPQENEIYDILKRFLKDIVPEDTVAQSS